MFILGLIKLGGGKMAYLEGCDDKGKRFAAVSGWFGPTSRRFILMTQDAKPIQCEQCFEHVAYPCSPKQALHCVNRPRQPNA